MTVRDLLEKYGLTNTDLRNRFNIPDRSLRSWTGDPNSPSHRECPQYLVDMMDELLAIDKEKAPKE